MNHDDIVSRIKIAIQDFGPSPVLICQRLGIQKRTLFAYMETSTELRAAYNERVQLLIFFIKEFGPNREKLAKQIGKDRQLVTRYINENPEIKEAFADAEDAIIDIAEGGLVEALMLRDQWAIEFVLSTKGKSRGWSKVEKPNLEKEAQRLGLSWQEVSNKLSDTIAGMLVDNDAGDDEIEGEIIG